MASENFIDRLRDYYLRVSAVLRGEADAASVFANTSDIGGSREKAYLQFLRQHAPSKCNVFQGGFLFDDDGVESKQIDIIITTDTAPRFDFHNKDGDGKSFSPVEGTLGVVSVKSTLDKKQLVDALGGFASIPPTKPLGTRVLPLAQIAGYDDWPLKVVYATDGIAWQTLMSHIDEFYRDNPTIPINRRANFIHVAGQYYIARGLPGMTVSSRQTGQSRPFGTGEFVAFTDHPDLGALAWVMNRLQQNATASSYIIFSYAELTNRLVK
jgi:hypothetical protein